METKWKCKTAYTCKKRYLVLSEYIIFGSSGGRTVFVAMAEHSFRQEMQHKLILHGDMYRAASHHSVCMIISKDMSPRWIQQ